MEKQYNGDGLKKYTGTDEHVVIPDGIKSIEGGAFRNCTGVVSVHIPDSVEKIWSGAFEKCSNLKIIKMPKMRNTYAVSETAFEGCIALADENGFFICNNVLYRYFGNAETIVIPEGVEAIGQGAFATCYSVKEIFLPQSIMEIGSNAFGEMNSITIHAPKTAHPKIVSDGVFKERGYDEYAAHFDGERKSVKYVLDFECEDDGHVMCMIIRLADDYTSFNSTFSAYTNTSGIDFNGYDEAVILGKRYKAPDKLYAALLRMANPQNIKEPAREWYTECLRKNVKKAVALACESDNDLFIKALILVEAINAKNIKALKKLIAEANAPKCQAMIDSI